MAFDPNKLTNAQQQKIFKVLDWIEEHGGESAAKAQFATKLKQLGKDLGLDDKETEDLKALIDRRLGESRLIKAAAQCITETVKNQVIRESVLSDIIRDILADIKGFAWQDDVELAIAILSRAARDAKFMARGESLDAKAAQALEEIIKKLDRIVVYYGS